MTFDESELAGRAAEDPDAFAVLFDRYYGPVYNYVRYRVDHPADAEDLTALVFERLLKSIRRYDPERSPFEPWLFAIARNAVNDHLRRVRLVTWLPWAAMFKQPSAAVDPCEAAAQREERECLARALRKLDARQRELLGLKFHTDLSHAQIAELTGLSESNVGVIVFRAIERLRKVFVEADLKDYQWEEEAQNGRA